MGLNFMVKNPNPISGKYFKNCARINEENAKIYKIEKKYAIKFSVYK